MIQRRQTLWLLLTILTNLLSFIFPFMVGDAVQNNVTVHRIIDADGNFIILILTGGSLILSSIIIFLYKNRKQQIQFCLLGLLLSILIIVLYFLQMNKLTKPVLALSCILPFLTVAGYFMAFQHIRKDEKLIKDLDKLR